MKITSVEVFPITLTLKQPFIVANVSLDRLDYVLLKIHTDEDTVGIGEASPAWEVTGETQETVLSIIKRFSSLLMGKDPYDIETIMFTLDNTFSGNPSAKAAIEMALYDIVGKSLKIPVYKILGGSYRESIMLPYVAGIAEVGSIVSEVSHAINRGFRAIKVKAGLDPTRDVRTISTLRKRFGEDIVIFVDANQGWRNPNTAIKIIKRIEPFGIEWVEQPIIEQDIKGLSRIRNAVNVPIMVDETVKTPSDALKVVEEGAADIINNKAYEVWWD